MNMQLCPACGEKGVGPRGISNDVLIVLEHPTETDMDFGKPFAPSPSRNYTSAGQIMRSEMLNLNLDLNMYETHCLWLHEPSKNPACFEVGRNMVLDAAKGKKVILLLGNLSVQYFTGYSVYDVNGLEVDSAYLSAPKIVACVNPTHTYKNGLGEFRFGLQAFYDALKEVHLA